MKIYLAATFARQEEMRYVRDFLRRWGGHRITSRWLDPSTCSTEMEAKFKDLIHTDPTTVAEFAEMNLDDITRSDRLLVFTTKEGTGRAHNAEFGYALALMPVEVIGPREHIFHTFPDVLHHEDFKSFVQNWIERNLLVEEAISELSG